MKKDITMDEYVGRLLKVRAALSGLNYKTVYSYEYNEPITKELSYDLLLFWTFRKNDKKILERFEWIVKNFNMIPEFATSTPIL